MKVVFIQNSFQCTKYLSTLVFSMHWCCMAAVSSGYRSITRACLFLKPPRQCLEGISFLNVWRQIFQHNSIAACDQTLCALQPYCKRNQLAFPPVWRKMMAWLGTKFCLAEQAHLECISRHAECLAGAFCDISWLWTACMADVIADSFQRQWWPRFVLFYPWP